MDFIGRPNLGPAQAIAERILQLQQQSAGSIAEGIGSIGKGIGRVVAANVDESKDAAKAEQEKAKKTVTVDENMSSLFKQFGVDLPVGGQFDAGILEKAMTQGGMNQRSGDEQTFFDPADPTKTLKVPKGYKPLPNRPDQTFNRENQLRDEYNTQKKDFTTVKASLALIEQATANPSPAGDMTIVYSFVRLLDPGSVVREGEFATAENSPGLPERIRGMVNKAIGDGRLSNATRMDFLKQARGAVKARAEGQKQLQKRYADLAVGYGLKPSLVIDDALAGLTLDDPQPLTAEQRWADLESEGLSPKQIADQLAAEGYKP